MAKEPLVEASVKSDELTVPETTLVVQYNVVPLGTSVVVTVNVTVDPSFTEDVDGDTAYVGSSDVSLIVIVLVVATIVPEVDPVLISIWKLSDPSVVASLDIVLENDPDPPLIVKDPLVAESLKSDALIVPETTLVVQYNVVPSSTSVVVTESVTEEPSFTEVVEGDTAYVGVCDVSLTVIVPLVAIIVPEVDPVLICI